MIRIKSSKDATVRVTWALPLRDPEGPVSVVGDFNDWTPGVTELRPRANGTRSATVTVSAGETLRFRYLGSGGLWFDDDDATNRDQHGCVLRV